MNKKILFVLGFLIICFGTAFIQYKTSLPEKNIVPAFRFQVKQIITIDDKHYQSTVQSKTGSTALQLLGATHKVASKGEKENTFITAIDGRVADSKKREFWAFYVNGKQATVGAGSYRIKNNDTIEWKIETY
ncbi:MAG: DUF4430 domain-containing protein [bacterium]